MGVNRFSCHVMKSNFRAYGNRSEYAGCTVGGQMFFFELSRYQLVAIVLRMVTYLVN